VGERLLGSEDARDARHSDLAGTDARVAVIMLIRRRDDSVGT